jgi:catechol 2,3-dioxygenase-like lactoylglutathione lyase family enzyme
MRPLRRPKDDALMSKDSVTRPARRFLHVCYCCADTEPVKQFFVNALAMRNTMSTPEGKSSGAILGLPGEILGSAAFVYDSRGPRISPAIEVQSWIEPPLAGRPMDDPTGVGIQALGFSVPELPSAVDRLVHSGCTVTGSGRSTFGTEWTTIRDATGVTLDLVEDPSVPSGETRLRHLRITCTDLARSVPWYQGLGFDVVATDQLDDASFLGVTEPVEAVTTRLRLPDEGFEAILMQWKQPTSHGRHYAEPNHAGLYRTAVGVDDTRAAYDALSSAGWTFDRPPMSVELTGTPVPDMWISFLSDPDGVPFELVERPRAAFRS